MLGGGKVLALSQSIIVNVGEEYIETYLKNKRLIRTEEENSQGLKYWVDSLLDKGKINVEEFEKFLFDELFWGKRKTIWVYKLDKIKDYKYPEDWKEPLDIQYSITSINFCNILCNIPNKEKQRKIAAVYSEGNAKGELTRIKILFACYIQINEKNGYKDSVAYIPVELDFSRKIMIMKAWRRQQIAHDKHKAEKLMLHIKELMESEFKVRTRNYDMEHKTVLFHMSKNLIQKAYCCVPNYNEIRKIDTIVMDFIEETLGKLSLRNVEITKNGTCTLMDGVMDFEAEIKNVIEALTISDYFFDRDFNEIWEMGLEAVVTRIKFNDEERVLTSLSGENTSMPIFCTKTFMSLKNRMEAAERVETLWIAMNRKKGNLNLKFDASNMEYLEILIKYGIRFNETDMNSALDIYDKYESELNQQITEYNKIAVG